MVKPQQGRSPTRVLSHLREQSVVEALGTAQRLDAVMYSVHVGSVWL